jgi:hypothetical protein
MMDGALCVSPHTLVCLYDPMYDPTLSLAESELVAL